MKIKMILTNALIGFSSFAFAQQIVDLSTGVVNGSSTLIAPGQYDDTWTVKTPLSNGSFIPIKCAATFSAWQQDPAVRWISPSLYPSNDPIDNNSNAAYLPYTQANLYYQTTFSLSNSTIRDASITFLSIGGDNVVQSVLVNNYPHALSAGFNPLSYNRTIDIPANELNPTGVNTLVIKTYNTDHYTGLSVNGYVQINFGDGDGGPDVTICKGSCGTLHVTNPLPQSTYTWYVLGSNTPFASGPDVTVCPTVTTTYQLAVQSQFGTTWDQVIVSVQDNNPAFTLVTSYTPGNSFYTCFASPTTALPANGSYSWIVEEIVSSSNPTIISGKTATNPSCWWNSAPYNCDFHAYDGSRATVMDPACANPTPGHFTAGHTYRITRGTWSNVCSWTQYSVIVYKAQGRGADGIIVEEDKNAPDYSATAKVTSINQSEASEKIISVFPNPGNGIFNISTNHVSAGTIEIYDMTGRKVESVQLKNNTSTYEINLTNHSKGIYFLNLISGDKKYTEKIVVE